LCGDKFIGTLLKDMMRKAEGLGASRATVGMVFPRDMFSIGRDVVICVRGAVLAQATEHASFAGKISGILCLRWCIEGRGGRYGDGFVRWRDDSAAVTSDPSAVDGVMVGIEKS